MDPAEVRKRFERAYRSFLEEEASLFAEGAIEPTIAARLAGYLNDEFEGYKVDLEYARRGGQPKYLPRYRELLQANGLEVADRDAARRIDIVIHERGVDHSNLLAIEIKRSSNSANRLYDRLKLRALREALGYQQTLFFELEPGGEVRRADWCDWRSTPGDGC